MVVALDAATTAPTTIMALISARIERWYETCQATAAAWGAGPPLKAYCRSKGPAIESTNF